MSTKKDKESRESDYDEHKDQREVKQEEEKQEEETDEQETINQVF